MKRSTVRCLAILLAFMLVTSFFSCYAQATEIKKDTKTGEAEKKLAVPNELGIQGKSFILLDAGTGKILFHGNEHEKMHPASITKIMTIMLTLEAVEKGKIKLTDKVTASELAMNMGGTEIWLEPGEQMSVEELLIAASVGSANDACVALAEHIAGSETSFVKMMNKKAQELGMKDTFFRNSNGLPEEGHHTSANDIALLCQYAFKNYPQILKYTSIREYHLREGKTWLVNTNHMLGVYKGMDGIKTGWTEEAGFCLAATAQRDNFRLIAVELGAENPKQRAEDITALLNYGFANYSAVPIIKKGEEVIQLKVKRGIVDKVKLLAKEDLVAVAPADEEGNLKKEVFIAKKLVAPLQKGQVVGELRVKAKGELAGKVDLIVAEDVRKGGILRSIFQFILSLFMFWQR